MSMLIVVRALVLLWMTSAVLPLSAQDNDLLAEKVAHVLEYAKLGAVVGSLADAFPAQVQALLPEPLDEAEAQRLADAVQEHFSVAGLRELTVAAMTETANDTMLDDLLGWLPTGASSEIDALVDDEPPAVELETYAQTLSANPPPQARILVVAEWATAQAAADFYVLVSDAHAYAVHQMAGALSADAPVYQLPTEAQLQESLEGAFNIAVISFLQRFESIPDALIREATTQYSSESGQWFVEAYTLALNQAIRWAGDQVAAELSGS